MSDIAHPASIIRAQVITLQRMSAATLVDCFFESMLFVDSYQSVPWRKYKLNSMVLSECFVWKYHVQVFSIFEIVHPLHTISNAAIACLTPNPTLARASIHHNINHNQEYSNLEQACVEEVGPLPSSRSCVKHDGTPRPLL